MGNILVAEDSFTQRQLIADFLEERDFTVTTATNGVEALAQVLRTCPDVVVLDVVMPQLNGYEVCRRLKTTPETQDIPVIMCSVKTTEVDRYWGLKIGADAYIGKPFQKHELIEAIERLLSEK